MSFRHLAPRLRKQIKKAPGEGTGPRNGWTPEMLARKEEALGPNPSGGFNHDALGCEFFRVGLWDKAASEFRRAVAINPWEPMFKFHLARAYLAMREIDQAQLLAKALIEQAPVLPETALANALVFDRRGERSQARRWYDRCLTLKPDYWIKKEAEEALAILGSQKVSTNLDQNSEEDV